MSQTTKKALETAAGKLTLGICAPSLDSPVKPSVAKARQKKKLDPLLEILIHPEIYKPRPGYNSEQVADLVPVAQSEHERREGIAERAWKARHKFVPFRQTVLDNPEFNQDWDAII